VVAEPARLHPPLWRAAGVLLQGNVVAVLGLPVAPSVKNDAAGRELVAFAWFSSATVDEAELPNHEHRQLPFALLESRV